MYKHNVYFKMLYNIKYFIYPLINSRSNHIIPPVDSKNRKQKLLILKKLRKTKEKILSKEEFQINNRRSY